MYYYHDQNGILQGPFSKLAYAKWYVNGDMPPGTKLIDGYNQKLIIDDLLNQSFKSRAKVVFCEDPFSLDGSCDRTELDVTLELDKYNSFDSSISSDDFTQLEEGVDEADCGEGSEKDVKSIHLQRMVNIYVDRRPLNDQYRQKPDNYVPFEYPWNRCAPFIVDLHEAIRGAVHLVNQLQCYDEQDFSYHLDALNMTPRRCYLCHLPFTNSYQMLSHFLSVIHINRTYDNDCYFSMIDVNCVMKIMSDFESDSTRENYFRIRNKGLSEEKKTSFFDEVDITTAFESVKNTVCLLQTVPLLCPPPREASGDTCEYIEYILFIRKYEVAYCSIKTNLRSRRLGASNKTFCEYCNVEFDATQLDSFSKHLLSDIHMYNAIHGRVSRRDMEYWLSFIECLLKSNHVKSKNQKPHVSLQEGDFPLCYKLADLVQDDFVYTEKEVDQALNFAREEVRKSRLVLEDIEYRTSCRWCNEELHSRNSVIHHVLYNNCHRNHLKVISNDDLRRFFRLFHIPITMPLFRTSFGASSRASRIVSNEKEKYIQRLQNACYRIHKHRGLLEIAIKSFPFGLVNRCDLCEEGIEHVYALLAHFWSEKHTNNLRNNFSLPISDFKCWLKMFNVQSHSPQIFYFS